LIERYYIAQVKLPATARALDDWMVFTIEKKNRPFLGAEHPRPTTVEMTEAPVSEDDGVLWRNRVRALRAGRGLLFRH
jgi:hypothetical protein